MKIHIPRPTDELMWLLAEQRDSAAIDTFCSRYPEFRGELLRRVNMLYDLKAARGEAVAAAKIPQFRPHEAPDPIGRPWMRLVTAGIGLLSVAWAAYLVTDRASQKPVAEPAVGQKSTASATNRFEVNPKTEAPTPSTAPPSARVDPSNPTAPPIIHDGIEPVTRALDKLITIRLESSTLLETLAYISKASKVKIEIGPGLTDRIVTVDYVKRPTLEILKDLGASAGFTVFEQGDAEVLIIPPSSDQPAKRPDLSPEDPPESSNSGGVGIRPTKSEAPSDPR